MRFPRSILSLHAEQRITERFRITRGELLDLLNSSKGKKIGVSGNTQIIHRLLWSHVDKDLLVAIQDVVTGTVLTLLPLDLYRTTYKHNVTERRIRRVINQMVHAGLAPPELWAPGAVDETVTVYAQFLGDPKQQYIGLLKHPVTSADLALLGKSALF